MIAEEGEEEACLPGNDGHPEEHVEYPYGQMGSIAPSKDGTLYVVGKCGACGEYVRVVFGEPLNITDL